MPSTTPPSPTPARDEEPDLQRKDEGHDTARKSAVMTREEWIARELSNAPPITERQARETMQILLLARQQRAAQG